MLAQAGVGRLVLIDPERLAWANLGRHPLGAGAVGANKARALANRIVADYPHIVGVEAKERRWEAVAKEEPDLLSSCDLVVSATADWASDGALNEWHLAGGRHRPVVYGWTEPYASAGHAIAIARDGGCLQCGFSESGVPRLRVTRWEPGSYLRQ
jgi:molybdopterin/thiamine biosynthesis adenylyltransferase